MQGRADLASTLMNWNLIVALTLVVSSAGWVTAHVAIAWGLWRSGPRRRFWLVWLPPTALCAPVWSWQARSRGRAVLWLLCALVYLTLRFVWRAGPE